MTALHCAALSSGTSAPAQLRGAGVAAEFFSERVVAEQIRHAFSQAQLQQLMQAAGSSATGFSSDDFAFGFQCPWMDAWWMSP